MRVLNAGRSGVTFVGGRKRKSKDGWMNGVGGIKSICWRKLQGVESERSIYKSPKKTQWREVGRGRRSAFV